MGVPTILLYKLKLIMNNDAKEQLFKYFVSNITEEELIQSSNKYSRLRLPQILNPEALSRIKFLLKQNDTMIIISAHLNTG